MATKTNLPVVKKETSAGSRPPSVSGVNAGSAVPGTRGTSVTPSGYTPGSGMWQPNGALTDVSAAARKAGDTTISDTNTGKNGGTGGGGRVTYIGNDNKKKTGTVKVTPGTTPDFYTQLGNLYAQAHEDQIAANAAALEAALQRIQETREEQSAALSDQYAGSNRQLYRDYMEHRRVLPQQLAAMGYNGGLSESSLLRLGNSYEEGLNENERARIAQEAELGRTLAQQEYEARQKAAEADSTENQEYYGKRATLQQMIYSDAQQRAATMAAAGDFSEYKRLGFSDSEIAWLKRWFYKTYPQLA